MDPRFSTRQAIHSLHSLSRLPGNVNQLEHLELGLLDVQVFIEAAALAPLGHNCQVVLRHVPHEEQDVHVPGFAEEGRGGERKGSEPSAAAEQGDLVCFPTVSDQILHVPDTTHAYSPGAGKANTADC